ncbi:ribosomal-protein-alanine N-acetyltransferase [Microbacterium caowuchunii]|uniref:Ribosomal-protein-alanine N-acetyltransferase n=2 Tax=Microbacterium caowuchunii TaxID=2614638 RepID=A0A5N0TML7_9MICO|nr:ribosomal-protein-alanine N-acetyltransferase [Microbacterium caowuchunii]
MMIRPATIGDLDAIMRLERASFPSDAWSEAMMREELRSPHSRYVVWEEAARLLGYAGLRAVAGARDGDVQTIAVAESARGRGQGRMLLRTLIAAAHERGVRDLFLEVRADNPVAQELYRSEGFAETGRRPRYYQPDDVDAIVMTLDVAGWAAARGTESAASPDPTSQDRANPAASGEESANSAQTCEHPAGGWCT